MNIQSIFELSLPLTKEWLIERIDFNQKQHRLIITLKLNESLSIQCPKCKFITSEIYKLEKKEWRYFPFFENDTYILASQIWINCPTHGEQTINLPWNQRMREVMKLSYL